MICLYSCVNWRTFAFSRDRYTQSKYTVNCVRILQPAQALPDSSLIGHLKNNFSVSRLELTLSAHSLSVFIAHPITNKNIIQHYIFILTQIVLMMFISNSIWRLRWDSYSSITPKVSCVIVSLLCLSWLPDNLPTSAIWESVSLLEILYLGAHDSLPWHFCLLSLRLWCFYQRHQRLWLLISVDLLRKFHL